MLQTETVLIILLSVGFLILLILAIVLVYILIMILRSIQRITKKAEDATDNFNETMKTVGKKVAPAALSAVAASLLKKFRSKK